MIVKRKEKPAEDELVTIQEAATLRGVTRTRIYQWVNEGRLRKEEKYGRSLVYRSEVLAIEALPGGRPNKSQ
jgi:excisionase family DNA binding protein